VGPYFGNPAPLFRAVRTDPTCKRGYSCRRIFFTLVSGDAFKKKKRTLTKQVGMGRNLHVVVDILSSPIIYLFIYFSNIFFHSFDIFLGFLILLLLLLFLPPSVNLTNFGKISPIFLYQIIGIKILRKEKKGTPSLTYCQR
jgi:hypothetical protein